MFRIVLTHIWISRRIFIAVLMCSNFNTMKEEISCVTMCVRVCESTMRAVPWYLRAIAVVRGMWLSWCWTKQEKAVLDTALPGLPEPPLRPVDQVKFPTPLPSTVLNLLSMVDGRLILSRKFIRCDPSCDDKIYVSIPRSKREKARVEQNSGRGRVRAGSSAGSGWTLEVYFALDAERRTKPLERCLVSLRPPRGTNSVTWPGLFLRPSLRR